MKPFSILYSRFSILPLVAECWMLAFDAGAQLPTNNIPTNLRAVMVDTNSVVQSPTNFWAANSNAMNRSVSGGGGGGGAAQSPLNGNVNAAGFNGTNYGTLQATNINATNVTATNINATNVTATNFSGGIFNGVHVGPGTNTSSTNFSGSLAGNVTGTQGATVVSSVGSAALPAAQITGTINDARLSANVPLFSTLDDFSAHGLNVFGNFTDGSNAGLGKYYKSDADGHASWGSLASSDLTGTVATNALPPNLAPLAANNGGQLTNIPPSSIVSRYWTNILAFTENFSGTLGNWLNQGTASFTIVSGHLHTVSGGSAFGDVLIYTNYVTAMHDWTVEFDLTPQTTNSGDGFGWGIRSLNTTADVNLYFLYGSDTGSITVWYGTSNSLSLIGGSFQASWLPMTATGQTLHFRGGRRDNVWVWNGSNTVTGVSRPFSYTTESSATIATNGFEPNTGSFALWSDQGTQDFDNLTFKIGTWSSNDFVGVGDSITSGYGNATFGNGYPQKLKALMPSSTITVVSAGNDKTAELLLRTNEINLIPSATNWVMIGGNDVASGISATVWKANLTNFVNAILPGRSVVICMPTPWDTVDTSPVAQFVQTNIWPAGVRIADLFNPVKNSFTGTTLKTIYSFDGIHLNDVGSDVTARALFEALNNRN